MKANNLSAQNEKLPKRRPQLAAVGSLVVATAVSLVCVGVFLKENFPHGFLKDGDPVNPATIHVMKKLIRTSTYIIMPAMSALLILNSYLLLVCSREFYTKSGNKF